MSDSALHCDACDKLIDKNAFTCNVCHDADTRWCSEECRASVGWVRHEPDCNVAKIFPDTSGAAGVGKALAAVPYAWQNLATEHDWKTQEKAFPGYISLMYEERAQIQTRLPSVAGPNARNNAEASPAVKAHSYTLTINDKPVGTFSAPDAMISEHSSNPVAQSLAQMRGPRPGGHTYWVGAKALGANATEVFAGAERQRNVSGGLKLASGMVNTFILGRGTETRSVSAYLHPRAQEQFAQQVYARLGHGLRQFVDAQYRKKAQEPSTGISSYYAINPETSDTVVFTVDKELQLVDLEFYVPRKPAARVFPTKTYHLVPSEDDAVHVQALIMALEDRLEQGVGDVDDIHDHIDVLHDHLETLNRGSGNATSAIQTDIAKIVQIRATLEDASALLRSTAALIGEESSDSILLKLNKLRPGNVAKFESDITSILEGVYKNLKKAREQKTKADRAISGKRGIKTWGKSLRRKWEKHQLGRSEKQLDSYISAFSAKITEYEAVFKSANCEPPPESDSQSPYRTLIRLRALAQSIRDEEDPDVFKEGGGAAAVEEVNRRIELLPSPVREASASIGVYYTETTTPGPNSVVKWKDMPTVFDKDGNPVTEKDEDVRKERPNAKTVKELNDAGLATGWVFRRNAAGNYYRKTGEERSFSKNTMEDPEVEPVVKKGMTLQKAMDIVLGLTQDFNDGEITEQQYGEELNALLVALSHADGEILQKYAQERLDETSGEKDSVSAPPSSASTTPTSARPASDASESAWQRFKKYLWEETNDVVDEEEEEHDPGFGNMFDYSKQDARERKESEKARVHMEEKLREKAQKGLPDADPSLLSKIATATVNLVWGSKGKVDEKAIGKVIDDVRREYATSRRALGKDPLGYPRARDPTAPNGPRNYFYGLDEGDAAYGEDEAFYGGGTDEELLAAAFPEDIAASPKFDPMTTEAEFSHHPAEVAALRAAIIACQSLIGADPRYQQWSNERDRLDRQIRDLQKKRSALSSAMRRHKAASLVRRGGRALQKKGAEWQRRGGTKADEIVAKRRAARATSAATTTTTTTTLPAPAAAAVASDEEEEEEDQVPAVMPRDDDKPGALSDPPLPAPPGCPPCKDANYGTYEDYYGLEELGDEMLIALAFPEHVTEGSAFDPMSAPVHLSEHPVELREFREALIAFDSAQSLIGADPRYQQWADERNRLDIQIRDLRKKRRALTVAMWKHRGASLVRRAGRAIQKRGTKWQRKSAEKADRVLQSRPRALARDPDLNPDYDYGSEDEGYGSEDDMYGYATEDEIPHELVLAEAFPQNVVEHAEFDPMTTPAVLSFHPDEVEALRACISQIASGLIGADTEGYKRLKEMRKGLRKRSREYHKGKRQASRARFTQWWARKKQERARRRAARGQAAEERGRESEQLGVSRMDEATAGLDNLYGGADEPIGCHLRGRRRSRSPHHHHRRSHYDERDDFFGVGVSVGYGHDDSYGSDIDDDAGYHDRYYGHSRSRSRSRSRSHSRHSSSEDDEAGMM